MAERNRHHHSKKRSGHHRSGNNGNRYLRKCKRVLRNPKKLIITWIILSLFVSVLFYALYGFNLGTSNPIVIYITTISVIFSILIGFYIVSKQIIKYERSMRNDNFSIWLRRILSLAMTAIGAIITIICLSILSYLSLIFSYSDLKFPFNKVTYTYSIQDYIFSNFIGICLGLGLSLLFLSLYYEYVFEKKSGQILFIGRQKF